MPLTIYTDKMLFGALLANKSSCYSCVSSSVFLLFENCLPSVEAVSNCIFILHSTI